MHRTWLFPTCALLLAACASSGGSSAPAASTREPMGGAATSAAGELGIVETRVGTGARAMSRQCVYVHYVGLLSNGKQFESTRDTLPNGRPQPPIAFELGTGAVLQGWDKGIASMQVGGARRLYVPYRMAYGTKGVPPNIPPRADLVFDIELMAVAAPLPTSSNAPRAESARTCPTWTAVSRSR